MKKMKKVLKTCNLSAFPDTNGKTTKSQRNGNTHRTSYKGGLRPTRPPRNVARRRVELQPLKCLQHLSA